MIPADVLVVALAIAASLVQNPPGEVSLSDLTVPASQLPSGCSLTSAPWIGTDAPLIADIREALDPPQAVDGPPLSRGDAARYRIQLADGIAEAYRAQYRDSESRQLVTVEGLRFATADAAAEFARSARASRDAANVVVRNGPIVAVALSATGVCAGAVREHLRILTYR